MHTLENLKSVVIHDWARECAGLPFLHTCKASEDKIRQSLSDATIVVPDPTNRNPSTVHAEAGLGIPPSVYFFVGRCYPCEKTGAMVVAVKWRDLLSDQGLSDQGEVSPFDTGGVYHDHSRLPWNGFEPGTKSGYVAAHSAPLSEFGKYFAGFLSRFFLRARSYMRHPDTAIDGVELTDPEDWRDWTFEVRVPERVRVADAKWYCDQEADSHYVNLVADGRVDPLPDDRYEFANKPYEKAEADASAAFPG